MKMSISTSEATKPWHHKQFTVFDALFLEDILSVICRKVWSPIVWNEGKRLTENFVSANLLVFDFDDGAWSVNDAANFVSERGYRAVIGTTKSHGKEKNGLVCDRFRLVLEWTEAITHYETYRQNTERMFTGVPCDRQCKDGARMYQPCREIYLLKSEGLSVDWLPYKEPIARKRGREYYSKYGTIPRFVQAMIAEVPAPGRRNEHCFRIAAKLSEMGFSEDDCLEAVRRCAVDLPEKEKEITARSGYKSGSRRTS